MDRQEAAGVLREIGLCGCVDLNFISITDSSAQIRMKSTGYEIYIKCTPGNNLIQCLTPILQRHNLKMADLKEAIIIYKPKEA